MSSSWSIVEIGQIASEVSAVNDSTDYIPVLSCTKYDGLVDSLQYFKKQVFSHDTSNYKLVRRGQFAYATNHIEEGSIGYQDLVSAGLVSPIYTVFQADASRVDDGYLYKVLKTEKLRQLFAANTNASVDRRGAYVGKNSHAYTYHCRLLRSSGASKIFWISPNRRSLFFKQKSQRSKLKNAA